MANKARLSSELTDKQFAFFNILIKQMETLGEMHPKQAAIEAGYSENGAAVSACRLLKSEYGQTYLKSLHKDVKSSSVASLEWVMDKLTNIVNFDVQKDGLPNYQALQCVLKSVAEINKIKGHYAPDKKVNLNMTMDDVQFERAKQLAEKYTRKY